MEHALGISFIGMVNFILRAAGTQGGRVNITHPSFKIRWERNFPGIPAMKVCALAVARKLLYTYGDGVNFFTPSEWMVRQAKSRNAQEKAAYVRNEFKAELADALETLINIVDEQASHVSALPEDLIDEETEAKLQAYINTH